MGEQPPTIVLSTGPEVRDQENSRPTTFSGSWRVQSVMRCRSKGKCEPSAEGLEVGRAVVAVGDAGAELAFF